MSVVPDKQLGMDRQICRRDFLNGIAVTIGAGVLGRLVSGTGAAAPASELNAQEHSAYYPPALTGMRGSAAGSFESAHALRDGNFWKQASPPLETGESYDLIVIGAGISGLAAAYFYRKQNSSARILILDNHDDFGGHATRNEFRPGGRLLIVNGGSADIDSPFPFSSIAQQLMEELGIVPAELSKKCELGDVYKNLDSAYFFDKETFGHDKLLVGEPGRKGTSKTWKDYLAQTPLAEPVQLDIARLYDNGTDFMPGLSSRQKKDRLAAMSYKDYLLKVVKVSQGVLPFFQTDTQVLYGVGIDAVNALDCWGLHFPGFAGLNLEEGTHPRMGFTASGFSGSKPPYNFHFPDGNASVARLLLRALNPAVLPGHTVEDIVVATADYSKLDLSTAPVRIRLSSTALKARHLGEPDTAKELEVFYIRDKKVYAVRGKDVVMACWNGTIPYLCPELPARQKEALHYGVKVPLVYSNVAIKNWKAFQKLGVSYVSCPGMYHTHISLDRAVSTEGYKPALCPDEPIVLRLSRTPCLPGLSERDQHKAGRAELMTTSFETFERKIRDQLFRVLGAGGFDPARDIEAITVNRWPHGYAYEYNYLFDPQWPAGERPCEIARKPFGRIAIANSDAAAAAYVDQAIDQAYRAVQELKKT